MRIALTSHGLSPSRPHTASSGGAIFSEPQATETEGTSNVLNIFFHSCFSFLLHHLRAQKVTL
jgi:hypothetical protein